MQPNNLHVTALVSAGKHPTSGRARRAEQDARAIEMGLHLSGQNLEVLHAGDPANDALRAYAGMGVDRLRVISQEAHFDVVPALSEYIGAHQPDIILTGVRSESGESSGMLPYLLGQALSLPVVTRIAEIERIDAGFAYILQALPRGQRRSLKVALPFIGSVDMAACAPRQNAYARASRANIQSLSVSPQVVDEAKLVWQASEAVKRPKRLMQVKAKTAAERFKAATVKSTGDGGKVMRQESHEVMAKAIFDLLLEEGVVRS